MKKRIALLLALAATTALAQDDANEEEVTIRSYTVEMIIFSYAREVTAGSEIFVPEQPETELLDDVAVYGDEPSIPDNELPDVGVEPEPRQYEIEMLARDDFSMGKIYDHIRRLDVYKPLMHFGWTQPTLPEEEPEARPLSSFATPPEGLDGELTLYLSRFLHLSVDLKLDAPATEGHLDSYGARYPIHYRIAEDRIFRNGELRYFDHPKFGVLARITRVEEEDDDPLDEPELFGSTGQ